MNNGERSSCFRVLSVQSHVVSGYVGNKSACFPLQVLGFEIDLINSVHLSNHTEYYHTCPSNSQSCPFILETCKIWYKHVKGQCLNAEDLQEIYDGLKLNDLTSYTHILTGYVGTVTFLSKLGDIIKELKKIDPSLYYVCDPVMGDNGNLYVPKELLPIYRDQIIPLANLITPNQYETELLTGVAIKTKKDVLKAMAMFHDKGVETVVLSSVELQSSDKLQLFGSSVKGGLKNYIHMEIPKLSASFTGTGDLFSALLLAWMAKTEGNLKVSCEKTVNTMYCVLQRTLKHATGSKEPTSPFSLELKLVQSKKDIENPPDVLKCVTL